MIFCSLLHERSNAALASGLSSMSPLAALIMATSRAILRSIATSGLLPGQRHDTPGIAPLLASIAFDVLLGDKGFESDWLQAELGICGAIAVIPANRKAICRLRHPIGNFFAKRNEFRAVVARFDKSDDSFRTDIHLAAAIIAIS
jgi:hypothetical protein